MILTVEDQELVQQALNVLHHFYRQQRDYPPPTVIDPDYAPWVLERIEDLQDRLAAALEGEPQCAG